MLPQIYLVRHGETAWSKSRQHTGRTELPLTAEGEAGARGLAETLSSTAFARVLSSPRQRALRTCVLAGLGDAVEIEDELSEWDYGDYEGLTTAEILRESPDWNVFRDGCPQGETPVQVSDRADRLLARLRLLTGKVAVFSHGHFGRVLAVRWIGLPVKTGQSFGLSTASISILGFEHADASSPVIELWNFRSKLGELG